MIYTEKTFWFPYLFYLVLAEQKCWLKCKVNFQQVFKLGYNKRSYKVENLAKLFNQDSENGNQIRKTIKSKNALLILRAKMNRFTVLPMY